MPDIPMDRVIATYIKLRAEKEAIDNEAKLKTDVIKTKLEKFEAWIKTQADAMGVTSFKSVHGTAFLATSDFASVADWDAVLNFIKTNEAYDLLNHAVNKNAVRAYMDANKAVPDGVTFGTKVTINIRKPSAKAE